MYLTLFFLLQVPTDQLVNQTFNINPTTVYGVFAGFLVVVIMVLCLTLFKLYKAKESSDAKFIELLRENLSVIENISQHYTPEARKEHRQKIVDDIDNALSERFEKLTEIIRSYFPP